MMEKIKIIFEDSDILVINKPPGLVVNRAKSVEEETLQDWFSARYKTEKKEEINNWSSLLPDDFDNQYGEPEDIFVQRNGLVHRLDKDTSGVLILAKNPGSLINLLAQFKQRKIRKKYTCLVHGKFQVEKGSIIAAIARSRRDTTRFSVTVDGRESITQYQVVSFFSRLNFDHPDLKRARDIYQQGFSLVECEPKTGRTHQIRVHMSHIQHPLVGDKKYVGRKRAKLDPFWCPRQFLHASFIEFTHPRTKERISFSANLSVDLTEVLQLLEK